MPRKKRAVGKRKYAAYGKLLKRYREEHSLDIEPSWSQERLAEALGISMRKYQGWESGEGLPSPDDLKNFVGILGLSEEEETNLYRSRAQVPPEIRHLPFDRNRLFTGRDSYLALLDKYFEAGNRIALAGLGGIGKTQIALEYAYSRHPDVYRAVLWVNAADEVRLAGSYGGLAEVLKLPVRDEPELAMRIRAIKQWLEDHTNWLLIMDNADDLQLARSFFPSNQDGRILLTTRSLIVGNIAAKIDIESMTPDEGLRFLLRRADPSREATPDTVTPSIREAAAQVVELLGGHSLALDQAGAYIEETGASFTEYINLYHEQHRRLLDMRWPLQENHEGKSSDHPESVVVTFRLCFEKASERHALAADILYFCAFLQPDYLSDYLFMYDGGFKRDIVAFRQGIAALRRYSLLTRQRQRQQTFSMHRLVQTVLFDGMSFEEKKQWRPRVVRALRAAFTKADAEKSLDVEKANRAVDILLHMLACIGRPESYEESERDADSWLDSAYLSQVVGLFFRAGQLYPQAEELLLLAFVIYEEYLGVHPNATNALQDLAELFYEQGKYEQAERLLQESLASRKDQLGDEHPDTIRVLRLLETFYRDRGKQTNNRPSV